MTFFGNKRSGRHLSKNNGGQNDGDSAKAKKPKWSLKKKLLVIPGIVVAALAVLTVSAFAYLKWASGKPPEVAENPAYVGPGSVVDDPDTPSNTGQPPLINNNPDVAAGGQPIRAPDKYTFLLLATDDGSNTDTIMVATFDTAEMTFEVVNIPRDTMVNVSWNLKKANSILANMRVRHRGESDELQKAMDDTVSEFAKILGFHVDYWALVNLRAFVTLVNAVDGVDFFVPVSMNYDDYDQNLHIHYNRGMQHLYGQQALEVVRFRNTYGGADITRISVQQNFLTAAVQQILEKRDSLDVFDLATVFIRDVKTNIPFETLVWFGVHFLKMNAENITFETAPGNYIDYVGIESYVTLYVDEWLELVNRKLSTLNADITDTDVSILTRGADRRLYVTDGDRQGDPSWGANSRGPNPDGTTGGGGNSNPSSGGGVSNAPQPGTTGDPDRTPDDGDEPPGEGDGDPSEFDPDDDYQQGGANEQNDEPTGESSDAPGEEQPDEGSYEHPDPRLELPPETIEPLDSDPYGEPGGGE